MRGLSLLLGIVGALGLTVPYPFVGVLLWSWFALQQPHREVYGIAQALPLNLILAIVTLATWIFSRERKIAPAGFIFWLLIIFLLWMAFNSFLSFDWAQSGPIWDRTWKTFLLGFVIAAMCNTRLRMYALIWIVVIALFYFGVKGGLFTILTGGHFHVNGPDGTQIGDNNQLATALLMVLPLANYLRGQVADRRISLLLGVAMGLTTIAVVGSYSRGALIGLGALGLFMTLRARNRFVYLATAAVLGVFIISFMPETFFNRAATITGAADLSDAPIGSSETDASFEGRLDAWRVAFLYAKDHFPIGAGFSAVQMAKIYNLYSPGHSPHAAHSIYFEVLGDHGFIGLAIYLMILAASFLKCSRIMSLTKNVPDLRWACDLAVAIQASLFVFCVAGAALSLAYYDLLIIDIAMLLPLWAIARAAKKVPKWKRASIALPQVAAVPQNAAVPQ
jgi:probable O-glycosylation ligase (exosortase A-associated)